MAHEIIFPDQASFENSLKIIESVGTWMWFASQTVWSAALQCGYRQTVTGRELELAV
jgi:hypothetical protein